MTSSADTTPGVPAVRLRPGDAIELDGRTRQVVHVDPTTPPRAGTVGANSRPVAQADEIAEHGPSDGR